MITKMMKKLKISHMNILRRLRLRRICKRLRIKPYPWQKAFALGTTDFLDAPPGRQTGKTMAVMLRLLMMRKADYFEASRVLHCDLDFSDGYTRRYAWYSREYRRLAELCGVKPLLDFERFVVPGGRGRHG